jgi:hypothetical protein
MDTQTNNTGNLTETATPEMQATDGKSATPPRRQTIAEYLANRNLGQQGHAPQGPVAIVVSADPGCW